MSGRQGGHRTRGEERIDGIDISPTALLERIESLERDLEGATRERDDYLTALQRERADFQNFKRRQEEQRALELGLAGEDLIRKVLVLADDFDRAIAGRPGSLAGDPWAEGIAAIDRKLRSLLESEGVRPIEGSPGIAFDPRMHEAVATVPMPDRPEGTIVDEVRRGYLVRDRVLRPALVAVAAGGSDGAAPGGAPGATSDRPAAQADEGTPAADIPTEPTDRPTTDRS